MLKIPPKARQRETRSKHGIANLRVDVLAKTSLVRIVVLGHIAGAPSPGGHNSRFQHGGLEIRRLDLGRLSGVGHVSRAAAAMGGELSSHMVAGCSFFLFFF